MDLLDGLCGLVEMAVSDEDRALDIRAAGQPRTPPWVAELRTAFQGSGGKALLTPDKAEVDVLQPRLFGEPVVEHRPREANVPADAVAR